jgi:hypothetical protein
VSVRIFPGHVQDGKIVPDAEVSLDEGTPVTVIADSPEASFSLSNEQEAELLDAIEAVDRGEVISAAELLTRLKT